MEPEPPYRPRSYVRPEPKPQSPLSAEWQTWLRGRGISAPVWERNGLRSDAGRLMFPYYHNAQLVNWKYRTPDKQFSMVTDAELVPYGWDDCEHQDRIVIVEGEMDKLAVEQATGWTWVLSPPNGANHNDAMFEKICAVCKDASQIILAGDMDEKGRTFQEKLAERLGLHRCWRVQWPEKDANDTLLKHGEDAVRHFLAEAQPYPVQGIISIMDLWDEMFQVYDYGIPPGIKAGWTRLDQLYSIKTKQLTTVTGAPGFGKSTWITNYLVRLAHHHEWRFAICSPETQPQSRLGWQLAQQYVGKPWGKEQWATTQQMSRPEAEDAARWVNSHFHLMLPERNTIENIIERARILKERWGINGFLIDPVNTIEEAKQSGQSTTEYIHQWTNKLRAFMVEYDLHIWLVAHPSKGVNARRDSQGRVPVATPYDIADSAAFYNRSDNIISVWRDPRNPAMGNEIHVQKIRYSEIGREGMVTFDYDLPTTSFRERS